MLTKNILDRWSGPLLVVVLLGLVFLSRAKHLHAHASPTSRDAGVQTGQETPALEPSMPPSPAVTAELQAHGHGLHWLLVDPYTVTIVTAQGGCGTLSAIGPDHISFYTVRDANQSARLFSTWSDAYAAAELYCEDRARGAR